MNGFYGRQYSGDDLHRLAQVNSQNTMMGMMGAGGMGDTGMAGGQTLDEIITQNNKEIQRRRSYQQQYIPTSNPGVDSRRASMMEFGAGTSTELESFQFDPSPTSVPTSLGRGGGIAQRRLDSQRARRRQSDDSLALNTQFQSIGPGFNGSTQSPVYHHSLNSADSLDLDVAGTYLPQSLGMNMDYSTARLDPDSSGDIMPMNMYSQGNFSSPLTTSPVHQQILGSIRGPAQDPGGGTMMNGEEQDMMDKMPNMNMSDPLYNVQNGLPTPSGQMSGPTPARPVSDFVQSTESQQVANLEAPMFISRNSFSTADPLPNCNHQNHPNIPQYRNAYSSSGFDMLGVLMRVATRPKPQINIGAVDMSCAFVVCDVTQYDLPIVYCSDIFERLTGYTKHEILGRNCRFLQAPDGKVQSGIKRKYVDDQAVLHLKNMINQRQEAQISLINYRKGGQPFMNLLTMIPITYDSDEIKYFVGFQVDLVEQPTSITNKNPGT